MSESKAMILGCAGKSLTPEERSFYSGEQPWGFILFARNIGEAEQVRDLTAALRDSIGRPDAPVLIDQEGGRVQRIRPPLSPNYPPAEAIGGLYRQDRAAGLRAAWLLGRLHATDLAALGISVNCLPVLDVLAEGATQAIGNRSFGSDPEAVTALGRAVAEGLMAGGLLPVMKHMPGHGRAKADSHLELPVVDAPLEELRRSDFQPFKALSDLPAAMTAHIVFTAVDASRPATTSRAVIDQIIRGEIGFDGLLMSDDTSMKALSGDFADKASGILAAGCDLVLHCNGVMEEMRAIASGTAALTGKALQRAEIARSCIQAGAAADPAALLDEFMAFFEAVV